MTLTKTPPRRPTATHKKRHGQHHNQGRQYLKHYWPYLPVFAVLLVGIAFGHVINRSGHGVLGYSTDISATTLLADTNSQRATNSEPALALDAELTTAAQAKANDMAKRDYWSHVTPDGMQPWQFIQEAGYRYASAGENLAYGFGTAGQTMDAWMHSPEHKANILNKDYTQVGFAVANAPDYLGQGPETIIVALYASPAADVAVAPTVTLTNQAQTVSHLQLINSATWLQLTLAAVCGAALMLFFTRHALAWKRVLVRGEHFALKHPFLDVFLVSLFTLSFLLSHAAGTIL